MKFHILLLFALLLFININLLSQSGWFQQNSGTNNRLYSCYFINDQTGFAGGANGTLLKTTNGGTYWYSIYNQPIYNVYAMYFSQNNGWAVISDNRGSDSCFILRTTNYGLTWDKYFTDTNAVYFELADIQFTNAATGFISKQYCFLKTTNSGINFVRSQSESFSSGLYFINSDTGWVGGIASRVYFTSNGGFNWNEQNLIYPHQYSVDFYFLNSQKGFCIQRTFAGDGPLYFTSNSGINWTIRNDLSQHHYVGIQFLDSNIGFMLAENFISNSIARTTNKGLNWDFYNFESPKILTNLFFSSVNTGWVVGDSGIIMKTTTSGVPIGIHQTGTNMPRNFSLSQNYPNPFNPVTKIKFDISGTSAAHIVLSVFDELGREVKVLVNKLLKPGTYEAEFDGTTFPSGIYYYKIQAGDYSETKKMVLLK